ncbi:DUF6646 family protein [Aequorivita viscosa]|uniref:Outer membrane protein beta-barrel domain-containing protein n=1 Tax=Aequorivita viscosa TaxID=797419 RepID=A0A1M6DRS4_9FLAO|nr:DUF6646 family protein [Aequorivita viscosa]SDW49840.1 hypothetical protein SAMN05216556_10684 [Aequorivita viscosa]SHI75885.1 hypothetical protein SAMN04487908_10588 [Aequorivita viscosa]
MKTLFTFIAFLSLQFAVAQAYHGAGDIKFQIGANLQNNGTGIMSSLDFGLGENISVGFASSYLLGIDKVKNSEGKDVPFADFKDRFDLKARFNANLGNVINIDDNFDVYPGLYVSLKNFGGHLGARYFFSQGFGIFTEVNVPISKYNTDTLTKAEELHNQVTANIGVSFCI